MQHFDSQEWFSILDGQGLDAGDVAILALIPVETHEVPKLVASVLLTPCSLDAFLV